MQPCGLTLAPGPTFQFTTYAQVRDDFYPAVQQLLQERTGGTYVHIFDHTVRTGSVTYGPVPFIQGS